MISTVLSHALSFFGRGFLIAGLIPCLLLAAVLGYLCLDYKGLADYYNTQMTQTDWMHAAPEVAFGFTAIYLLAYVLYGVRTGVHQFFQGRWPFFLGWLRRLLLARERLVRRRREASWEAYRQAVDIPTWVDDFKFGKAYSPILLSPNRARKRLKRTREALHDLLRRLQATNRHPPEPCWEILREARLLQANRERLPPALQDEVDQLVAALKAEFETIAPHREYFVNALKDLRVRAEREWDEAREELLRDFPADERWLQPTRLGNVAVVLELYSLERYGIPLSTLWPRLQQSVTEDYRKRVEEANIYLDFAVILSLNCAVAAIVAVVTAFQGPPRPLALRILLPVLLALLSRFFFRLAIEAMRIFGVQVQTAVDLFRLKLLDELGLKRPSSYQQEQEIWTELREFFVQGDLPEKYVHFKEAAEKPKPDA